MTATAILAVLSLLCHPPAVPTGVPFYITASFATTTTDHYDIHVDILNEGTNAWVSGDLISVRGSEGNITARLEIPLDARPPFVGSLSIAPVGEQYPNVLNITHFPIGVLGAGEEYVPCAPIKNQATGKRLRK